MGLAGLLVAPGHAAGPVDRKVRCRTHKHVLGVKTALWYSFRRSDGAVSAPDAAVAQLRNPLSGPHEFTPHSARA